MRAQAHLLDFGMVTCLEAVPRASEACNLVYEEEARENLAAGGGTPLYASLAQLQGRPTTPVDDIESLWYCLAFLEQGQLPWQWEPQVRAPSSLPAGSVTCTCTCAASLCACLPVALTCESACGRRRIA